MFPFSTPFAMWSPLRVELVQQRLEEAIGPPSQMFQVKALSGKVSREGVAIYVTPRGRGAQTARVLKARMISDGGGTRLEGQFRLRWGNAIAQLIMFLIVSGVLMNQLFEALERDSGGSRVGALAGPFLLFVVAFGIFLGPIFSPSKDRRLVVGLEMLLASERPKWLDDATS